MKHILHGKRSQKKIAFFRPTFWRRLSGSGRDEMFGRKCVSWRVAHILFRQYERTTTKNKTKKKKQEEEEEEENDSGGEGAAPL